MKRDIIITLTIDSDDIETDYSVKSKCSTPPTRAKVLSALAGECEKIAGYDGCTTHPIRIWVLRRALEYLRETV